MDDGWIKLHRKFLKWEWFEDPKMVKAFVYILLMANHENRKWQGILIKRGQHLTSRKKLAKNLKLSEQSTRTVIQRLKSTNEITTRSTNNYTIITVTNYDQYQQINQPTNKRSTSDQPATNHKQELKKEKKDKKYISSFNEFWELYPRKVGKQKAMQKYMALCKKDSSLSAHILNGLKKQLPKFEITDDEFIPHPTTWLNNARWEDEIRDDLPPAPEYNPGVTWTTEQVSGTFKKIKSADTK